MRPLLVLLLMLLASCTFPQQSPAPSAATQTAAPAYNLYSWKDDGNSSYNYALLEASSQDPNLERVRKEGSADLTALLKRLQALKAGTLVRWNAQVSTISSIHFLLPPTEVAQRIRDTASQHQLNLQIDAAFATATP